MRVELSQVLKSETWGTRRVSQGYGNLTALLFLSASSTARFAAGGGRVFCKRFDADFGDAAASISTTVRRRIRR